MEPTILTSRTIPGCVVSAVLGDITAEQVDAVVNAANTHLAHGGGLAGAIVRRGGRVIQDESDGLAPVAVGSAAVTGAGELPCTWVIHAVGPRWGEGDEEHKLRSAVRASLDIARRLGAATISLPAISTGIFGYPKADGTRVIVDEVFRWLGESPEAILSAVRLTAFDRETAGLFAVALDSADRIELA
jgi:O-acetyl-ADP-ribose deacetylase (regulator of RNase III)